MISFKLWLKKEEITSTANIAHFQNRLGLINRRNWWLSDWEQEMQGKKAKNKKFIYRVPQVSN